MDPPWVGQLVPTLAILKVLESESLTAFLSVDPMAAHLGNLSAVMKDLPLVDLVDRLVSLKVAQTVVLSVYLMVQQLAVLLVQRYLETLLW